MSGQFRIQISLSLLLPLVLLTSSITSSSLVVLDSAEKVEGLWCLTSLENREDYYYLPSQSRLATDDEGKPAFSLLRYVETKTQTAVENKSMTSASGGALLHMLVEYITPQQQIQQAERALREKYRNENIRLLGPIQFKEGQYRLVSSILGTVNAEVVISGGKAPVTEGSRLALSIHLSPTQAALLLQSFQMSTPDVSLVFEMNFEGLSIAYDATILIDWDRIHAKEEKSAGINSPWFGAEVKKYIDELIHEQAVHFSWKGSSESMEALMSRIYQKVADLLFFPSEEKSQTEEKGTTSEKGLFSDLNNWLSSFSLTSQYQRKNENLQGTATISLNQQETTPRHHLITFHIGNFYATYGKDTRFFRDVHMDDPEFQQRVIHIIPDGKAVENFADELEYVIVEMEKTHQNGEISSQTLSLKDFSRDALLGKTFSYKRLKEDSTESWIKYRIRTSWKLKADANVYATSWQEENSATINLHPPFVKRKILLTADDTQLKNQDVKALWIRLTYDLLGEKKEHKQLIRIPESWQDTEIEITTEAADSDYEYEIHWVTQHGKVLKSKGSETQDLLILNANAVSNELSTQNDLQ